MLPTRTAEDARVSRTGSIKRNGSTWDFRGVGYRPQQRPAPTGPQARLPHAKGRAQLLSDPPDDVEPHRSTCQSDGLPDPATEVRVLCTRARGSSSTLNDSRASSCTAAPRRATR
jgi:hypothetical protein